MVWTAPAADGKTPINTQQQFPQTLRMAAATFGTTEDKGKFKSIDEKDQVLTAEFVLNDFYDSSALTFNADVVSGDINGAGRSDLIIASYNAKTAKIIVSAGVGETAEILGNLSPITNNKSAPRMAISMAAGDFDGDRKDEVILVWVDTYLRVQYVDFQSDKPIDRKSVV
jgi:hypothetical protein